MNNDLLTFRNRLLKIKETNKITYFNFLDSAKQQEIINVFKNSKDFKANFYGGYLDADYKKCIITPYTVLESDYKITLLKIKIDSNNITHRDVLGSILALGLKREVIGDIVIQNNIYVFVNTIIALYIIENLHQIKNYSCSVEISNEEISKKLIYQEYKYFVKSLRLDLIISNIINMSRDKTISFIKDNNVKINHELINNNSKLLKINDVLSIRGFGRFIFKSIDGISKSNNQIITILKVIS